MATGLTLTPTELVDVAKLQREAFVNGCRWGNAMVEEAHSLAEAARRYPDGGEA